MKKLAVKLLAAAVAVSAAAMPLTACGGKDNDPNTLNIVCLDKGYGTEWIETIVEKYKQISGKKVKLTASADAASTVSSHMASSNNIDDLYINVGSNWKSYAARGKFEKLDDIMDAPVTEPEGSTSTSTATVRERVLGDYAESLDFPDRNGNLHTYRLPWTAGVGGIYYNAKLFEEYGWTVPTTQDELVALCQTIRDDPLAVVPGSTTRVKPFIYTAQNPDYFDYLVYTWWGQLAGRDAIKEFCKFTSPDNFDVAQNATYAQLKTATDAWYEIFGNDKNYISYNTNHDAQREFANGKAAMMINGDWMYNEIINLKMNVSDKFELAHMKTPTIDGATHDVTYTIGDDQYIAIPSSSTKKGMAKDFIKLMISDWGCKVFADEAHGLLAYKGSLTVNSSDKFMQNIIAVKNEYDGAFTDYPPVKEIENAHKSTAMLNLNDKVNCWGTSAYRPYNNLLSGKSDINKCFGTIKKGVNDQWASWKKEVGIK